jgi:hypothetical protein
MAKLIQGLSSKGKGLKVAELIQDLWSNVRGSNKGVSPAKRLISAKAIKGLG